MFWAGSILAIQILCRMTVIEVGSEYLPEEAKGECQKQNLPPARVKSLLRTRNSGWDEALF